MDTYSLYAGQLLPFKEYFAPKGHNACSGCGVALAVRHVYKALGEDARQLEKAVWEIPWGRAGIGKTENVSGGAQPALLSIAKSKGKPSSMLQICFDNECTEGTVDNSILIKRHPSIASASGYAYVATACPSYPFDLIEKVRKAWNAAGPAYLHILCPCPVAWGFDPQDTVRVGRKAVETRIFPLYEIAGGYYTITIEEPNPRPLIHYSKAQERLSGWKSKKIEALQQAVDSAFSELKSKENKNVNYPSNIRAEM